MSHFRRLARGFGSNWTCRWPVGRWLSSQVVHTHPNRGFGVRFVDLTPRDQEALARAVEHVQANTA